MDGVSWAVLRGAVSLLGGDGVSLDLGSEEGRPHRCFSAFEMICLAGCAQSAFLERFGVQEYKCVLFFDELLLTTAFRQGLSWLPACIHSPRRCSVGWSNPPWCQRSAGLALQVSRAQHGQVSESLSWGGSTCLLPVFI